MLSRGLLFVVALSLAGLASCNGEALTAKRFESQIATSLPVGSTKEDVLGFLKRNAFECSVSPESGKILGRQDQKSVFSLTYRSIIVVFQFSEVGRLTGHTIKEAYTGP